MQEKCPVNNGKTKEREFKEKEEKEEKEKRRRHRETVRIRSRNPRSRMWRRVFINVRDRRNNGGGPRTRYVSSDYFKYLCYLFQLVLILDAARVD